MSDPAPPPDDENPAEAVAPTEESRAALEGYIPHSAHREVVERDVRPIMDSVIVVDYEI